MLRALRRTRLASLFALFIITGSVPISTAALLHDTSDDVCQPAVVQHDESAHRLVGAGTASPAAEHCAICHWLQSLKTVAVTSGIIEPAAAVQHVPPALDVAPGAAATGPLSARAPPAAL